MAPFVSALNSKQLSDLWIGAGSAKAHFLFQRSSQGAVQKLRAWALATHLGTDSRVSRLAAGSLL